MPQVKVPKASLQGPEPIPDGVYEFRVDSFAPVNAKSGGSVNLNPTLKIINHKDLADRKVYENLNSQAGWIQLDFTHSLGLQMQDNGPDDVQMPGIFRCKTHGEGECSCDPKGNWEYIGPMVGKTGRLEIVQASNNKGGTRPAIKRFFCAVPGCNEKHTENLIR